MKIPILHLGFAMAGASILCFAAPPAATPPATPPKRTTPPAAPEDPYLIKPKSKGPPAPAPPAKPQPPPHHWVMLFETYKLPQSSLDTLLDQPETAFYEATRKLAGSGAATLEGLSVITAPNGQRSSSQSVDECIYPTEFTVPVAGRPYGYPTAYEMRPTGEHMELEAYESEDGRSVSLSLNAEWVRLTKFHPIRADASVQGELSPLFSNRQIVTSVNCRLDFPTFIGTSSPPWQTGVPEADGDGATRVTFVRIRPSVPLTPTLPQAPAASDSPRHLQLVFRIYSIPREHARSLLAETVDANTLHEKVLGAPEGAARLEHLSTLITRSGAHVVASESAEWTYGTEFQAPGGFGGSTAAVPTDSPQSPASPPVAQTSPVLDRPGGATAFEVRPTGWRIEADPVVAVDGYHVDLNLDLSRVEYRGTLDAHPILSRYPRQPLFGTQRLTCAVRATLGNQCFLGTLNPPRDTGMENRKDDDGRIWLGFVKVTLEE